MYPGVLNLYSTKKTTLALMPHEPGNGAGRWVGEAVPWKMPPDQVRMSCVLLDNSPIWALIFPICKMGVMNYTGCL